MSRGKTSSQSPPGADEELEADTRAAAAIEAPQEERIAATLYYIGAYSHRKIADFPKLPAV